jgi:L-fuculose-phosphate aldolase
MNSDPDQEAAANLVRYYRWLRAYGLNDSHSGNASCRIGEEIWITPTGCCADTLSESDLIRVSTSAMAPEGASLDGNLHLEVYRHVPKAMAVLHSHGPCSIAMTMSGEDFAALDFEGRLYFGTVPVLDIPHAAYTEQSPEKVARVLREHRVAIVRGHGVYARGRSLDQAYKWTCSLESSARIAWLTRSAGIPAGETS